MNALSQFLAKQRPGQLNLPLVHVTPLSRYRQIMVSGRLVPQPCPVMKREIIYCSYGDLVYRPSRKDTNWDLDPPVALLFSPLLLQNRYGFAPMDTGAIASGRVPWFPASGRATLAASYCISDEGGHLLSAWIRTLYGGNDGYKHRSALGIPSNAPEEAIIARMLSISAADRSAPDHTRDDMRVISQMECHFSKHISLSHYLIAAFIPEDAGFSLWKDDMTVTMRNATSRYKGYSVNGNLPSELVTLVRAKIQTGAIRVF